MIHYHGTPCRATPEDSMRFLSGRHALVPFHGPEDIDVVANVCHSFCLDNGAYSFWKSGLSVDWDEYAEWVKRWHNHPGYDFAIIPDVIDGDEETNLKLIRKYRYEFKSAVPVYHMHESLDHARWLSKHFPVVAIGSSGAWPIPGMDGWWERMNKIMSKMCDDDGKPMCKIHGLRMLDPKIFTKFPFSSADSTNAVMNSGNTIRFGYYKPLSRWQRASIIASRIEAFNSAPVWSKNVQADLYELEMI